MSGCSYSCKKNGRILSTHILLHDVFAGRFEGCGQRSGDRRGGDNVFTALMQNAERPGGGRGRES